MVYFVEHVAYPEGTSTRKYQERFNPIWSTISGGCNCNRETLKSLHQKDWKVYAWEIESIAPSILRRLFIGLAVKADHDSSNLLDLSENS